MPLIAGVRAQKQQWKSPGWHLRTVLRHNPRHAGALVNLALLIWTQHGSTTATLPAHCGHRRRHARRNRSARPRLCYVARYSRRRVSQWRWHLARLLATRAAPAGSTQVAAAGPERASSSLAAVALVETAKLSAAALALAPRDSGAHSAREWSLPRSAWRTAVNRYASAAQLAHREADADAFCNLGHALSKVSVAEDDTGESLNSQLRRMKLRARGAYERALMLSPDHADAWYNLSSCSTLPCPHRRRRGSGGYRYGCYRGAAADRSATAFWRRVERAAVTEPVRPAADYLADLAR